MTRLVAVSNRVAQPSTDSKSAGGLAVGVPAAVGLVTPVRDGMNLVAKEFVASQDPNDPGVLVLSTLAGAAQELTDAVLVNPYDIDGVADAIHRALGMPLGERMERYDSMIAVLRRNDITAWRTRFVDALITTREHVRLVS